MTLRALLVPPFVLLALAACETPPHVSPPAAVPTIGAGSAPSSPAEAQRAARSEGPPPAPIRTVIDNYHGTAVPDPYRYMEDLKAPETSGWMKAQADYTRATLDRIPARQRMLTRIQQLSGATTNLFSMQTRGSRLFYLKTEPSAVVARLYVRDGVTGTERLLIDPTGADPGKRAAIDYFRASPDGRLVAYGTSENGSEASTLRVRDVATGKDSELAIDRVWLGESVVWHADGKSLFYNRLQPVKPGEENKVWLSSRAYRHVLGTDPAKDVALIGAGLPNSRSLAPTDLPMVSLSEGGTTLLARVMHGDAREISVYSAPLAQIGGALTWRRIASEADQVVKAAAFGDELYLLSEKGAPRGRILQTSLAKGSAATAKVALSQSDFVIKDFVVAQDALYLREMTGGVDLLQRVPVAKGTISGKREFVKMPFDMSLSEMVADIRKPGIIARLLSWTETPQYFQVDARTGDLKNLNLIPKAAADFSEIDEVRQYAMAGDGRRIPMTLLYRKGTTLNAFNPTLLTAYGSYGISLSPRFIPERLAWLERGGIIAMCHARGGGEYGTEWHKEGQKAKKENTVNDLIACAEYLNQRGFTQPARLALTGGSAGGIPVGNALLRRPELFAAAIPAVGVLDLLRFETTPNGPPNVLEFGSPSRAEDFRFIFPVSAYHQIKDGGRYPAVMATTGINDPRVEPWMSAKFVARLQAASASSKPVLLRVDYGSGHGRGSTRTSRDAELADVYSFALWQMGEREFQPQ
jgi:prolyl oligopeptidase